MKPKQIQILSDIISSDLQLDQTNILSPADSLDELRTNLKKIISHLLEKDFSRLLNALYRIDVSEEKVKTLLSGQSTDIASGLADLILERQIQKAWFRMNYRSEN